MLADTADAISMNRFRALNLQVDVEAGPDPGLRRRHRRREGAAGDARAHPAARRRLRRGVRRHRGAGRTGPAPLGDRPDRRHQELHPRRTRSGRTLIALMEGDQAVVGLVSAPALGRRWWAALGHGAYAGRHTAAATPIQVSGVRRLADASFCYSSLRGWEETGRLPAMLDIMRRTWRSRAYGDFYGYMLVAEGAVDIMVEPELSLWDVAALVPDRHRGRRHVHRSDRPARARAAAARSPPTAHCTMTSWPACPATRRLRHGLTADTRTSFART